MPAAIPLLIGATAFAGGALAAKKLAPKPAPAAAAPTPAPLAAPTPPDTAQLNSDSQAQAIQAGLKRRRTAMSGGILGPKAGSMASAAPQLQQKALIGGGY